MTVLLIAGSRDLKAYEPVQKHIHQWVRKNVRNTDNLTILTGMAASGPDRHAVTYCMQNGIMFIGCPANWDMHGKKAGMLRNLKMGEIATNALIFWDGASKGTKNMIDILKRKKIPFDIILTNPMV